MFDHRAFKHPAARNSAAYFWVMQAPMAADDLTAQLRAMYDSGVRSVCLHPVPKEFRRGASDQKSSWLPKVHIPSTQQERS